MTTEELFTLHSAVKERLDIVADHELRDRDSKLHLEKLMAAAQRLDLLVKNLPPNCDPMLRHYLERQSYTKALAWLGEKVT